MKLTTLLFLILPIIGIPDGSDQKVKLTPEQHELLQSGLNNFEAKFNSQVRNIGQKSSTSTDNKSDSDLPILSLKPEEELPPLKMPKLDGAAGAEGIMGRINSAIAGKFDKVSSGESSGDSSGSN